MITEKQKMEMKARKARAREAQTAEMLVVRVLFGLDSVFNRCNQKQKEKGK